VIQYHERLVDNLKGWGKSQDGSHWEGREKGNPDFGWGGVDESKVYPMQERRSWGKKRGT